MGVQVRVSIVIFGVHGGDGPAARLVEGGQVPLQHRQVVQGEIAHAGELDPVGQQPILVPVGQADQVVQLFRGVKALFILPEPVLGDVLQGPEGLAVHHAAIRDAALGVDGVDGRLW